MSFSAFIKKHNINSTFILFILIAAAICYFFTDTIYKNQTELFKKKEAAVNTLKGEIESLKQAGGNLQEKEANLKSLEEQYKELEANQQKLSNTFSNKMEVSKLLKEIVSEEKFPALNFESFYPMDEVPAGSGLAYIPVQIKVLGNFSNAGEYLKYVENLPQVFIEDINFKVTDEKNVMESCTAELKGEIYVLK